MPPRRCCQNAAPGQLYQQWICYAETGWWCVVIIMMFSLSETVSYQTGLKSVVPHRLVMLLFATSSYSLYLNPLLDPASPSRRDSRNVGAWLAKTLLLPSPLAISYCNFCLLKPEVLPLQAQE